jgi:hypothetical protein
MTNPDFGFTDMKPIPQQPLDWSTLDALERETYSPLPGLMLICGTAATMIGAGICIGWLLWGVA